MTHLPAVTRRTLLAAGTAVAAGALCPAASWAAPGPAAAIDDFALMRRQWRELHVTSGYDPADPLVAPGLTPITDEAQRAWSSMLKNAGRTYLWADAQLTVHESFAIRDSFVRLKAMALAWATPGGGLAANPALLADTLSGLDWMTAHWYNETRAPV